MKVEAEGLYFSYPGTESKALSDVSVEIKSGEKLAVMGGNGSGKTTFLKILAGILEPEKGGTEVDGCEEALPGCVGYAPENPQDGFFANTVREEIEFFPKNLGEDYKKEAEKVMKKLGMGHLAERSPFSLSAGEQRKVSVASALSGNTPVMAVDEPTKGLHMKGSKEIGLLLRSIDRTVIFTTHFSDLAYEFADRVLVLRNGSVLSVGKAEEVLSSHDLCKKANLEFPEGLEWAKI